MLQVNLGLVEPRTATQNAIVAIDAIGMAAKANLCYIGPRTATPNDFTIDDYL